MLDTILDILKKKLKQISYQNMFLPRSCIRSGLAIGNLFTRDIHRRIFRDVVFHCILNQDNSVYNV